MKHHRERAAAGLSRRQVATLALGAVALPIAGPALGRGLEGPATAEDEKFMRLALEEAALGDFPFGAVIVGNGEVLAKGRNLGKQEKDPTAHGEMVAIRNFLAAHGPDKLKGTTLYTSGESCPMCMGAIVWCGIGRVVYGASIAELATRIGQIMVTDAEIADKTPFADIGLTGGVLAEESLKLFKWPQRRTQSPLRASRRLVIRSAP
jgi:tRNA(Arg) A34 adenosine deaminase TadA